MALLNAKLRDDLKKLLGPMVRPVTLLVFVKPNCEACDETRALVEEVAAVADGKVRVDVRDLDSQPPEATLYEIDKAPAIVVLGDASGDRDFGIRFYGAPSGYEFASLIEAVRMASSGTPELSAATVAALARLTAPLHVQVFVTPTCPYCPRAVVLAHRLAMASDWVTADAVDATEFPDLADEFDVHGVPRTVINASVHIEGAVPEAMLMAELIPLLESQAPSEARHD